jgi:LysM repeat protein
MNNPVPAVDANGEWLGVWVLVDSDGMAQYQWDEATLTWEKVEVAYLPTLPEEAQPTEVPAAPATETPAATPAGEASAPTASAEAAPVEIPASLLSVPKTYSLHPGEFPFCLARRFDINPMELLYFNGLNENSVVIAYTKLRIPTSGRDFPPPRALLAHPATYTVKAGDTIYTIACKYGDVYPEAIAYANQLSAPFRLQAGQSLYIP